MAEVSATQQLSSGVIGITDKPFLKYGKKLRGVQEHQ